MKQKFLTLALIAVAVTLASCGGEDPVAEDKLSFDAADLMTKTVSGTTFFDYNGASVKFNIDYVAKKADIQVLNARFSRMMPPVPLTFSDMNANFRERLVFGLSGTGYTPMDGYVVNNVQAHINHTLGMYYMTHDVVTSRGTSQVYVYPYTIHTVLSDGGLDYDKAKERYTDFTCSLNADGAYEGSAVLHNVIFTREGGNSPQLTIRIPYNDLTTVTGTPTGYAVTGTGITGFYLDKASGIEIPFEMGEDSKINDLSITVDVVNKRYSIYFRCMRGEFSDSGTLYL